jgi:hypothetical protein
VTNPGRRRARAPASVQVRFAGAFGRLLNISATGALVQVTHAPSPERDWPILLNVEPVPVVLQGRVVRATKVKVELPRATWQRQEYAIGVRFTALPPPAEEAIKRLCGDAFSQIE